LERATQRWFGEPKVIKQTKEEEEEEEVAAAGAIYKYGGESVP
jgi:hypothetical protein